MAEQRPQFFTVLPSHHDGLRVTNGTRLPLVATPKQGFSRNHHRRSAKVLDAERIARFNRHPLRRKLQALTKRTTLQKHNSIHETFEINEKRVVLPLPSLGYQYNEMVTSFMMPIMQVNTLEKHPETTAAAFLEDAITMPLEEPEAAMDIEDTPPLDIISLSNMMAPPRFLSFLEDEVAPKPPRHILRHSDANEMDTEINSKRAELQMPPLFNGEDDPEKKLIMRVLNRSRILKKYLDPTTLAQQMNNTRQRTPYVSREEILKSVHDGAMECGDDLEMDRAEPVRALTPTAALMADVALSAMNATHQAATPSHYTMDEHPRTPQTPSFNMPSGLKLHENASRHGTAGSNNHSRDGDYHNASTSRLATPSVSMSPTTPRSPGPVDSKATHHEELTPEQKFAQSIAQKQRDKIMARNTNSVIAQIDQLEPPHTLGNKKKHKATLQDGGVQFLSENDQGLSLEELYEAALQAEKDKEWRRSTLLACACINIDKEWVEPIFLRARLCRRLGLWSQALKDLTSSLRLCPSNYRLHLQRAHIHTQLQDYSAAIHDLTSVLTQQPNCAEALVLRAQVYIKQNNIAAAIKDYTAIIKSDPKNWRAFYERGLLRHRVIEGLVRDSEADTESQVSSPQLMMHIIDDYVSALHLGCDLTDIVEAIGDVCLRLVECTQEVKHLLHTITALSGLIVMRDELYSKAKQKKIKEPKSMTLHSCMLTQRGRLQTLIGELGKAAVDLDRAVVLDYHYAPAHFYRGALASLSAHDEPSRKNVEQYLTRSITLDPTIVGAYIVRGGVYSADLRYNSALQDFKASTMLDPTLDPIWIQIGLVFLTHYHDCAACTTACSTALKNDRTHTQALYLRAEALSRLNNSKAAIRDYARLVSLNPTDRFAHLSQGRLLLQMGHGRPALYCYMSFMELSEDKDEVDRISRGIAYRILSQHAKAVNEFKLAVEDNPSSENLYLLSESLHSMGDTEASLQIIERAIASDPLCAKSYLRRAQCYIGRGALKSAILEYDFAQSLADKTELPRMTYERALCRTQLIVKCWQQLRQLQSKQVVECRFESNFKPGTPLPETLNQMELNVVSLSAYIKSIYVETLNDFTKCLKLSAPEPFADAYIDRAELYAIGGEYKLAYEDLSNALAADPGNMRAYIHTGILHSHFSKLAASIEQYDMALLHHPNSAIAYYNRGVAYHKLGVWTQAEIDYTKSIALDETNMDTIRNRGVVRCHLSDYAGALTDFEQVHRNAPDDLELYLGLGYVYLKLGRFQEAIGLFRASASVNPRGIDAFLDAGNTFLTMGLFLSQTVNPLNALHSSNAKADTFKSLLQQARQCYQRALRLNPLNVDCRLNLAALFRALKDTPNAMRQYNMVREFDPNNQVYHEENAHILFENGSYDGAIKHWSQAINLTTTSNSIIEMEFTILVNTPYEIDRPFSSSDAEGNMLDRLLQLKRLQVKEELKKYHHKLMADPTSREAKSINGIKKKLSIQLTERGKVYERLNMLEKARMEYLYAMYFDPLSYIVYFHIGTLSLRERRYPEALTHLNQAITLNPKLGIAYLNLGLTYMHVKAFGNALEQFDMAASLIPECGFVWSNRACVLLKLNGEANRKRAVESLTKAMKCMPTYAPFYVFRGRVLTKQRQLHDAMVDFATALKMGFKDKL